MLCCFCAYRDKTYFLVVVSEFGDVYPELKDKEAFVMAIIKDEEEAFSSMLVRKEGWC